jgi:hypothetical protein
MSLAVGRVPLRPLTTPHGVGGVGVTPAAIFARTAGTAGDKGTGLRKSRRLTITSATKLP